MAQKTKAISASPLRARTRSKTLKVKATRTGQADLSSFMDLTRRPSSPPNPYVALLGMEPRPFNELLQAVQEGLNYQAFDHFKDILQLPATEVAALLQIPSSTLVRRKRQGRLDIAESERLLRFSRLFAAAVELFEGDAEAARRWLQTPRQALNHVTPLEMARTELGAREVEKLIDRLENGVYS